MIDILIKNGTVIDGTGKEPFLSDVAVSGGVISDIARGIPETRAHEVIDATNKFVSPGFIDVTSHSDTTWTLFDYPGQESMLTQGITTIIGGNCGSSLAPLASGDAIKSIQKWTDVSRINTNWLSMSEFFEELKRRRLGVNFGTLIGHGTLRRGVIGEHIRPLSAEETEKTKFLVTEAMKAGAFGVSTGLGYSHEQPATIDEIANIISPVKEYGGVYKTHLRSEGHEGLLAAVNEAIQIGRSADVPVLISHLKAIGRKEWQYINGALEMIRNAREDGVTISFDVFPYLRTGSHLYQLLPRWAREGGFEGMFERLKNPATFAKIMVDMKRYTLHYERIVIASAKDTTVVGKTIAELARSSRLGPEEVVAELLLSNDGRVAIFNKNLSGKNLLKLILYPDSSVSTDGAGYGTEHQKSGVLVHPRSFGAFVHFLHYFVTGTGKLSWQAAVEKITSKPAAAIGLKHRGRIEQKYFADIVVVDPARLADRSTYSNPYRHSSGIDWVIVNGNVAIREGNITGTMGGKVLRKTGT